MSSLGDSNNMVENDQSSLLANCQPVEQVPKKWHGTPERPAI